MKYNLKRMIELIFKIQNFEQWIKFKILFLRIFFFQNINFSLKLTQISFKLKRNNKKKKHLLRVYSFKL